MRVVLLSHVPHIGHKGEVKIVRDGFAANFLIPQKLAQPVSDSYVPPKASENTVATAPSNSLRGLDRATISIAAKVTGAKNLYAGISAAEVIQYVKLQLGIDLTEKNLKDFKSLKHIGHFQIPVYSGNDKAMLNIIVKAETHGD